MQYQPARSRNFRLRSLLFVLLTICAILAVDWPASARDQSQGPATTVSICASAIDIRFLGETNTVTRSDLLNWVQRAGNGVCTYYGEFPVPHLTLDVRVRAGPGVDDGVTYPDSGGFIKISVGKDTTVAQLNDDWTLTHEMIHLAFPSMTDKHHWIEEGISVYVEPIARVQAGQLSAGRMWHDVVRDMPKGEPQPGDRGLDHTPTWGRIYWGGAMFCMVADVRIRGRTHNQKGLQDALRGILAAGGNITQDWELERALAVGDKATGTTVLADLYHEMRDQPDPVDLAALWKQLGVQQQKDGSIQFDPKAPEAAVRTAITRPPSAAQRGNTKSLHSEPPAYRYTRSWLRIAR